MTSTLRARVPLALALALLVSACGSAELDQPGEPVPAPATAGVDRVVFIMGDPGKALERHHPILPHMRAEVERWAAALGRDSAVVVLVMGDIIYPNGMHAPDDREDFPHDSALVEDQLDIVSGPAARAHHTPIFYLAGNHDWGKEQHEEGAQTLRNLDEFLAWHRDLGINARLVPAAGEPGPAVVDVGPLLRLVFLDTAWWLLQSRGNQGEQMIAGVGDAMRSAGDRHVVIVGHHPFVSVGPHGGHLSWLEGLGIGFLLKRSGAILQDLNSPPYRRLRAGLGRVFEEIGQPLLYAAGHEHSLQLIEARRPDEPRYSMVSGSASKLTPIGRSETMRYGVSAPGYFLLLIRSDGSAEVHAIAAPPEYLECPETPGAVLERCMEEGAAAYRPRFSQVLE